jgi:hypothetical protein
VLVQEFNFEHRAGKDGRDRAFQLDMLFAHSKSSQVLNEKSGPVRPGRSFETGLLA